ncbi:unnamed protein product [Phytophthora lilii]|uniref:Unnamed protein product n=1 Tax=Phytophthora lilii TaxID=2077276 RepID=A0A9W6XA57_9STRA|nr:unnamed protein product [Phytophthora lilii]
MVASLLFDYQVQAPSRVSALRLGDTCSALGCAGDDTVPAPNTNHRIVSKSCDINTSDRLQATGVPPHVAILREIKPLLDVAVKTVEHVDAARTEPVKDIMGELEQHAIGAGIVNSGVAWSVPQTCKDLNCGG